MQSIIEWAELSLWSWFFLIHISRIQAIGMLENVPTENHLIFYFEQPWAKEILPETWAENCIWIIKQQSSQHTICVERWSDLHFRMELQLCDFVTIARNDCPLKFSPPFGVASSSAFLDEKFPSYNLNCVLRSQSSMTQHGNDIFYVSLIVRE